MDRKGKNGLEDIYVIGCGPSLKKFDWFKLSNKTTIAINGAILDTPMPDYFVTADSRFAIRAAKSYFWHIDTYKVLIMANNHNRFKQVQPFLPFFTHRIIPIRFDGEIGVSESEFATGQNSGFCGMQLAVILGAKRIHLLGMDFHSKGGSNYHKKYSSGVNQLDEFYTHFVTAINKLRKLDIEVISHSPTSRLNSIIEYQEL